MSGADEKFKMLPMATGNCAFLLDLLGKDCAPLQYVRELTQNSIDAVMRTNGRGHIIWDVDWISHEVGGSPMKVCIIDTGDGMTGEEMIEFINRLSSSGSKQSFDGHFGVGAKIAAATKNPAGVIYQSWKNGVGNMIQLEKDPATGGYGLRQYRLQDGTYGHYLPLSDDVKPAEIESHGTKVILLGQSSSDVTIAPTDVPSPSRWISKYLNSRYFEFAPGLTIKAREGWDADRSDKDRNLLRTITGQKVYLDQHAAASGVVELDAARVRWWILKEEPAIQSNSGFIESAGHVAALYQNELYERSAGRAGTAMLQKFGILFGCQFVVIYAEPIASENHNLSANTARTALLLDNEKLPWDEWADEFREKMPEALRDFISEKAARLTERDHSKDIKERLKNIMDLFHVSRYRPDATGSYRSEPSSSVRIGAAPFSGARSRSDGGSGQKAGSDSNGIREGEVGNVYHLFEGADGAQSKRISADPFPRVEWVSLQDNSRTADDGMEDKAAIFVRNQNIILANADFRVFQDMIDRLCREKNTIGETVLRSTVKNAVFGWFAQALIETVIGVQQFAGSREWGPQEIARALCPEALTSAVMQRYHIYIACRRELGVKLGKRSAAS